jgi:Arc/MetJ-type ribon-helix-helix transcriptional regulator
MKERITAIAFRVNEHERRVLEELTRRDGRRSVSEYLRELIRKEADKNNLVVENK